MQVVPEPHCSPFCSRESAFSVPAPETKRTTDLRIWREESSIPCLVGHRTLYIVDMKGKIHPQSKSLRGEEVHVILSASEENGIQECILQNCVFQGKERKWIQGGMSQGSCQRKKIQGQMLQDYAAKGSGFLAHSIWNKI